MSKKQEKYRKGVGGPFLNKNEVKQMIKMYDDGNVEVDKICDCFQISKPTLYRYLREWKGRE